MARLPNDDFTCEQLIEALSKTKGLVLSAKKYLKHVYGIETGYSTIKTCIKNWEMEDWLVEVRKGLVEDCFNKIYAKGIGNGDNPCLFWVMERYGKHLDFLDIEEEKTESEKGWREILGKLHQSP